MERRVRAERRRGFTLVELLVTLAVVATLATLTVPVMQVARQRAKEAELRAALREIREAIDAYKRAAEAGEIREPAALDSGYPPSLDVLAEGVPYRDEARKGKRYFLRRLPRDPMSADTEAGAAATWGKRSYDSEAAEPREGADVFDVYSLSPGIGLNGIPYRAW